MTATPLLQVNGLRVALITGMSGLDTDADVVSGLRDTADLLADLKQAFAWVRDKQGRANPQAGSVQRFAEVGIQRQ